MTSNASSAQAAGSKPLHLHFPLPTECSKQVSKWVQGSVRGSPRSALVCSKQEWGKGRHRDVLNFAILHKHLRWCHIIQAPRDVAHIIPSLCQSGQISRGMNKALIVRVQGHLYLHWTHGSLEAIKAGQIVQILLNPNWNAVVRLGGRRLA